MSSWPRMCRAVVGSVVLLAVGCGAGAVAPEDSDVTGTVELALAARGSRGNLYRLSGALFEVDGPTQTTLSGEGDSESLVADIAVGTYGVELLPGWQLIRVADQRAVNASLRADRLEGVVVQESSTTAVRFAFDLADGEQVGLGRIEVGIEVNEEQDAALDVDGDGVTDDRDNCAAVPNPSQSDLDLDGVGDECDNCPVVANADQNVEACLVQDFDGDGVSDAEDNCPDVANSSQTDADADGVGDACDEQVFP